MKHGDQSIGWPTEIKFEYLETEYTITPRAVEWLGFSKVPPTHVVYMGATPYSHLIWIVIIWAPRGTSMIRNRHGTYLY